MRRPKANNTILSKLAVDDAAWKQYLARRESRTQVDPCSSIRRGDGHHAGSGEQDTAQAEPGYGQAGRQRDNLEQQFTRIAGSGRFATLNYSMTEKDGKPGLLVSVQEKPYSPPIVRPLIIIDGTNYNEVLFSAGARITFLDYGSFGSELRNDIDRGLTL